MIYYRWWARPRAVATWPRSLILVVRSSWPGGPLSTSVVLTQAQPHRSQGGSSRGRRPPGSTRPPCMVAASSRLSQSRRRTPATTLVSLRTLRSWIASPTALKFKVKAYPDKLRVLISSKKLNSQFPLFFLSINIHEGNNDSVWKMLNLIVKIPTLMSAPFR